MDIQQIPAQNVAQTLHEQVPKTPRLSSIQTQRPTRDPWDETLFVRCHDAFARQLGKPLFSGGSDKLSELAFIYERSLVPTLEGFAANVVSALSS